MRGTVKRLSNPPNSLFYYTHVVHVKSLDTRFRRGITWHFLSAYFWNNVINEAGITYTNHTSLRSEQMCLQITMICPRDSKKSLKISPYMIRLSHYVILILCYEQTWQFLVLFLPTWFLLGPSKQKSLLTKVLSQNKSEWNLGEDRAK